MYGESQQASYLINAKERNSETKSRRKLFNDRTNDASLGKAEAPVSPFKDQSSKVSSMRENTVTGFSPSSPVKSFDYRRV